MTRMAFHIELADVNRDDSRAGHDAVSDALEAGYLDEEAGLQSYGIFEKDGHVFGSLQVDDPTALEGAIGATDAVSEWGEDGRHNRRTNRTGRRVLDGVPIICHPDRSEILPRGSLSLDPQSTS